MSDINIKIQMRMKGDNEKILIHFKDGLKIDIQPGNQKYKRAEHFHMSNVSKG